MMISTGVLFFFLLLVDEARAAATYCLGGGQLAGAIFGTILGTCAVLAILFIAFLYLKADRAKGCPTKDVQSDTVQSDDDPTSSKSNTLSNDSRCRSCGHPRYDPNHEDKRDPNGHRLKSGLLGSSMLIGEKADKPDGHSGEPKSPHRFIQNQSTDQNSEYRTKKKKSSVFSSWWTHHTSSKRRISHSTESLNSVNEIVRIALKSRDSNGLGFNICGNVRDGIFVKSLSNRGPAKESGSIHEGDRILGVTINFENMVFEDALTIISYASGYPLSIELQRADAAAAARRRIAAELTPMNDAKLRTVNDSSSSSGARSNSKPVFHPLFKSQSIEDVSGSYRSATPTGVYSHIFDAIDATLEARRTKSLQYSPELTAILNGGGGGSPTRLDSPTKPSKPLCSLEVIEETPQLVRRTPPAPRMMLANEDDDARSFDSSSSSTDGDQLGSPARVSRHESANTTITVTAEINAEDCRDEEEAIVLDDPYAGLSYEDRLQIIRLSYEDVDSSSRCDPNSESHGDRAGNRPNNETDVDDPSQKVLDEFMNTSPTTLDSLLVSMENTFRGDRAYSPNSIEAPIYENGVTTTNSPHDEHSIYGRNPSSPHHDDEAASADQDDTMSHPGVESPSPDCGGTPDHQRPSLVLFPINSIDTHRMHSLTSPSGSSIGTVSSSSSTDGRLSTPEHSKRDSGYENNGANSGNDHHPTSSSSASEDDAIEKAQFEKLLYFQKQLAKQHEELARLGIHIPIPGGGQVQHGPSGE